MKRTQILTLCALTLLTLLGYVYIFGDSGLIIQSRLKKNLTNIKLQIQELDRENKTLNQKILSHSETEHFKDEEKNSQFSQSVILKFENNIDEASEESLKADMEPDLFELRSLYIITMLFITLVAVTLSVYLSGDRQITENMKEQE